MVTRTALLLHSRIRRIGESSSQLIYKDGSNVFVEQWHLSASGSWQLASTEILAGGHIITLPCLVGHIVKEAFASMERVNVAPVPL